MPRKSTLDESALTKDEIRKLSAFRESVGEEAGNRMFLEWLLKKTAIAFKPKLKDENAAMIACQRRSKSTPLAGVKMHHLMRFSPALAVVPVVHRRDPRCFV